MFVMYSIVAVVLWRIEPCYWRIDIRLWVPTKHPYGRHSHRCTPAAAIPSTAIMCSHHTGASTGALRRVSTLISYHIYLHSDDLAIDLAISPAAEEEGPTWL